MVDISNLCHLDISDLCHLERNKIIGEADDLVQSKDPCPFFLPMLRQAVRRAKSTFPPPSENALYGSW